jgi:hypothetical protein
MTTLDSQQIEVLGRSRVKAALIEAGLEVATPERDNGIDLIAYRWNPRTGEFSARPVQMKTASAATFGIDRKYARIPNLILTYVMNVRGADHVIYALTYREALKVGRAMGWTRTDSWRRGGGYVATRLSRKLQGLLEHYRMTAARWSRFF